MSVRATSDECKILTIEKDAFLRIQKTLEKDLMRDYSQLFDQKYDQISKNKDLDLS